MNLILLTTAIIITNIQSAPPEYISSVPQLISEIFTTVGEPCQISEDCDELFKISNMTAEWRCANETQSSNNITMCQFFECVTDDDCDTNEKCYTINKCDSENTFYDEYSTICYANDLCDTIKTEGTWTADDMCFTGSNDIYYSEEEVIICSKEEECLESETCIDATENIMINNNVTFSISTAIIIMILLVIICCFIIICAYFYGKHTSKKKIMKSKGLTFAQVVSKPVIKSVTMPENNKYEIKVEGQSKTLGHMDEDIITEINQNINQTVCIMENDDHDMEYIDEGETIHS